MDVTNILAKSFEKEGPEDTSPSDDAVKETAPVEESTEEAVQKFPRSYQNGRPGRLP